MSHTPTEPASEHKAEHKAERKAGMQTAFGLLGGVFLAGVVIQHLLGEHALPAPGGARFAFVLIGLAAFVLTAAAGFRPAAHQFLSSNRFAVPALVSLTVLSVFGTLILQKQPHEALVNAYGTASLLIEAFFFDDVFHSLAFSALLGVGAGGLALTVSRRRKFTLRYAGSLGAHIGLLLMLAGAAVGNVWVLKGRLNLHVGQTSESFAIEQANGEMIPYPLGFGVRLDEFRLEHYKPDFQVMLYTFDGQEERKLAAIDPAVEAERTGIAGVTVAGYWPDHAREAVVTPLQEGTPDAVAALGLKAFGLSTWLIDSGSEPEAEQVGGTRVAFVWDRTRAEALLARRKEQPTSPHVLVAGGQNLAVEVGRAVPLPGTDNLVQVLRAFHDFVIDPETREPTNRSDQPNNPAVEIEIADLKGKKLGRRWLFAKFPDFKHEGKESPAAGLAYRFEAGHGQSLDWIAVGETGEWLPLRDGEERQSAAPGSAVKLGETQVEIVARHRFARRTFRDVSRSGEEKNPLARVKLGDGRERDLTPEKPLRLDQTRALVLAPKGGETVRDYLSTLSIWEGGKKVRSKVVEVNYPLEYKGFVFYQADYRPDDTTFSGFQVVRDEGLWLVYSGFAINMLGVLVAVFLPPFLKRRKPSPAAERESGAPVSASAEGGVA